MFPIARYVTTDLKSSWENISTQLGSETWLSDEVIDTYTNGVAKNVNRQLSESESASRDAREATRRVVDLSSFLYTKYIRDGYMSVRRWTKDVSQSFLEQLKYEACAVVR